MKLPWRAFIANYWPIFVLAFINIVGGIYVVGFMGGQRYILNAARQSSFEAKYGQRTDTVDCDS